MFNYISSVAQCEFKTNDRLGQWAQWFASSGSKAWGRKVVHLGNRDLANLESNEIKEYYSSRIEKTAPLERPWQRVAWRVMTLVPVIFAALLMKLSERLNPDFSEEFTLARKFIALEARPMAIQDYQTLLNNYLSNEQVYATHQAKLFTLTKDHSMVHLQQLAAIALQDLYSLPSDNYLVDTRIFVTRWLLSIFYLFPEEERRPYLKEIYKPIADTISDPKRNNLLSFISTLNEKRFPNGMIQLLIEGVISELDDNSRDQLKNDLLQFQPLFSSLPRPLQFRLLVCTVNHEYNKCHDGLVKILKNDLYSLSVCSLSSTDKNIIYRNISDGALEQIFNCNTWQETLKMQTLLSDFNQYLSTAQQNHVLRTAPLSFIFFLPWTKEQRDIFDLRFELIRNGLMCSTNLSSINCENSL